MNKYKKYKKDQITSQNRGPWHKSETRLEVRPWYLSNWQYHPSLLAPTYCFSLPAGGYSQAIWGYSNLASPKPLSPQHLGLVASSPSLREGVAEGGHAGLTTILGLAPSPFSHGSLLQGWGTSSHTLANGPSFLYSYNLFHHQPSCFLEILIFSPYSGCHFPHGVHWADSSLGFILSFSLLCPWSAIMEAHHGSKSNELAVSIGRNPFLAFSNTSSPYRGQNLTLPLYMFALCLYPIWALPCQEYYYILLTRDRRLKSTCKESWVPF